MSLQARSTIFNKKLKQWNAVKSNAPPTKERSSTTTAKHVKKRFAAIAR